MVGVELGAVANKCRSFIILFSGTSHLLTYLPTYLGIFFICDRPVLTVFLKGDDVETPRVQPFY